MLLAIEGLKTCLLVIKCNKVMSPPDNVLGIAPMTIINRQLPFEYTIASRSTNVMVVNEARALDDDDDDTDDKDEEPFEDEDDGEEEGEHLAPADSSVILVVGPVPSVGDIEAFETDESAPTPRSPQIRIPFAQTRLRRARKTVRLAPPMLPSIEARIAEYAAAPAPPSPPPSPLSPWSPLPSLLHLPPPVPTSLPLPSSPLPPLPVLLFIPPLVDHREDIPKAELPPRKWLCPTAPTLRYEVRESSTAAPRPTGGHRVDYGFIGTTDAEIRCRRAEEFGYSIRDVWVDPKGAVEEVASTTLKGVNARLTELAAVQEQDTQDVYAVIEDTRDRQTRLFQSVDGLVEDRHFHYKTARLITVRGLCLTTPTSRNEVGESSTAAPRPTGGHKTDYGFIVTLDAEIRCQRFEEVGYDRLSYFRECILTGGRQFHDETAGLLDHEALVSREAWAHSMGLSSAISLLQGQLSAALGQIHALRLLAVFNNMPPRTSSATARAAAATAAAATPMIAADVEQLIEARVSAALANHETLRNCTNGHGDENHNYETRIRGTVRTPRECMYKDFLNCKPLTFKGTEGVVVLSQWFEKMESVFHISNCVVENQVKFATCTFLGNALTWWNSHMKTVTQDVAYAMDWKALKKMMTVKYCPMGEIKKLEIEL
ncbi:hypothetical protein Tco_0381841 [Tanacetum coccineum]